MAVPALAVQIQGHAVVTADNLNTYAQTCDTVAELRGFIGIPGVEVLIRGIVAPNDGGAGSFYWDASSTGPDDGVNVIVPTGSASGAWVRLTVTGTGGQTSYAFITTEQLLLAFSPTAVVPNGTIVFTTGRTVEGIGGGEFYYNDTDRTTPDNGGTIRVDTQGRRWYAIFPAAGPSLDLFGADPTGASDSAPGLLLFRNYALAINTATPNLDIPCNLTAGGTYISSNCYVFTGIDNLIVNGNGASLQNTSSNSEDTGISWWCGGIGYVDDDNGVRSQCGWAINDTGYLIETAAVGSNSVTCSTASQAANMTVGQWCLVSSQNTFYQGSPPGRRFLDYAKVVSTNASTGVVMLDRSLTNTYFATLPTFFVSGSFPSAANIFPEKALFSCRQTYNDTNFLEALVPSGGGSTVFAQGVSVIFKNCETKGGVVPSQLINGVWSGGFIDQTSPSIDAFETDKLNGAFLFEDVQIIPQISINTPCAQAYEFRRTHLVGGFQQTQANLNISNSTINGAAAIYLNLHGVFENSVANTVSLIPTAINQAPFLDIDGTTVTYSTGIITTPNSSAFSTYASFFGSIWQGCICDIIVVQSSLRAPTGGFVVIESMTDDSSNQYLGVSLFSLTATVALVHSGAAGANYAVNDTITLTNGIILTVATESGGAVETVNVTQPYATFQTATDVGQSSTSGSGTGAAFDITFGLPNGAMLSVPMGLDYFGAGNINGDSGTFVLNDQSTFGDVPFFPNGGTAVRWGNYRKSLMNPVSGGSLSYQNQHSRGWLKQVRVSVLRPYTGTQFTANTLFLRIYSVSPVFQGIPPFKINLSIPGERVVTPFNVFGAQTDDVLTDAQAFWGAYSVQIDTGGGPVTFSDATNLLPIIRVEIELDDTDYMAG